MERAAWSDQRLDEKMSAIDTTFASLFEEMRAERAEVRGDMRAQRDELVAEMRALRTELRTELRGEMGSLRTELRAELRGEMGSLRTELSAEIRAVDERLSRIGFRAAGILATGLIALVATQL